MSRYIDMCMQRRCMLCTALVQFMLRLMHAQLVHTYEWCMDDAVVFARWRSKLEVHCVLTRVRVPRVCVTRDDARERPGILGPL